jgi:hypothetical protein
LPLLPGLGAGTFGALAALHVGWALNFMFLLDGDKQGKIERNRYCEEFGIPTDRLATLDELVSGLNVIEDLLDDEAKGIIQTELKLTEAPKKGQIKRFLQERLASDQTRDLGAAFAKKANALLDVLRSRLNASD